MFIGILTIATTILCVKSALRIKREHSRMITMLIDDYFEKFGDKWVKQWWYKRKSTEAENVQNARGETLGNRC